MSTKLTTSASPRNVLFGHVYLAEWNSTNFKLKNCRNFVFLENCLSFKSAFYCLGLGLHCLQCFGTLGQLPRINGKNKKPHQTLFSNGAIPVREQARINRLIVLATVFFSSRIFFLDFLELFEMSNDQFQNDKMTK